MKTYDLIPEMSACVVAEELISRLDKSSYDLIVLNFANCDMVGHTGDLPATVKACETVDKCLGMILEKFEEQGIVALVTADHGNAEVLLDTAGHPFTAHTTNPVPLVLFGRDTSGYRLRKGGILADIAPTLLELMGLEKPAAMTGTSLLLAD